MQSIKFNYLSHVAGKSVGNECVQVLGELLHRRKGSTKLVGCVHQQRKVDFKPFASLASCSESELGCSYAASQRKKWVPKAR